jgi:outer membrane protein assembly factor BamB
MIADGKIVALEETGVLIVAEATPEGYNELSRAHVLGGRCWTPPVLCDGRIYCRNAKGDLICLDVERVE